MGAVEIYEQLSFLNTIYDSGITRKAAELAG
jgi:hypothetical protein